MVLQIHFLVVYLVILLIWFLNYLAMNLIVLSTILLKQSMKYYLIGITIVILIITTKKKTIKS